MFRFLLFENYGAFVLFGSKPMCVMNLVDGTALEAEEKKLLAAMSDEQKTEWQREQEIFKAAGGHITLEHDPYKGWEAWGKIKKHLEVKNFILATRPEGNTPGVYFLLLAHIQRTAFVLSENYNVFKEATGMDFHPLEVVFELENPNSIFWNRVFEVKNHLAKGLLFGFGMKNSLVFDWKMKYQQEESAISTYLDTIPYETSTEEDIPFGEGNASNFTIPRFGNVAGEELPLKYEEEKREIEKIYRNKDLVEVSLEKLGQ